MCTKVWLIMIQSATISTKEIPLYISHYSLTYCFIGKVYKCSEIAHEELVRMKIHETIAQQAENLLQVDM